MAKRIEFQDMPGVRVNETELSVLRYLGGHAQGSTVASLQEIASTVGKSEGTVRLSLRKLDKKGLVSVRERFLRNGGQLENEYELTQSGTRVLHARILTIGGVRV